MFAKEGEALKGAQKNGRRVYLRKITKKWNYLVIFSINCYLAVTHGRNAWVFARLHGGLCSSVQCKGEWPLIYRQIGKRDYAHES